MQYVTLSNGVKMPQLGGRAQAQLRPQQGQEKLVGGGERHELVLYAEPCAYKTMILVHPDDDFVPKT